MKTKYSITGLDCSNCAAKLAANMEKIENVDSAKINFLTEKLIVEAEGDVFEELLCVAKKFSKDIEIKA